MNRQPTTQQITWFLDLYRNSQLDLEPPYQRRSVWSSKDRKFFLDTIFRNYPAPPIFVHRTVDDNGFATYHVVDGKQRLETIVKFFENKISIDAGFGDVNLAGKKFKQLTTEYKRKFWDYTVVVDFIDSIQGNNIEEVFDRVNRNARNLQPQELRHARFNGWFISLVEDESEHEFWWDFKISSRGRDKRMRNVQFISELFLLTLEGAQVGFDQQYLDDKYAHYDEIDELVENGELDTEEYLDKIGAIKETIKNINSVNECISNFVAGSNNNFYTLWGYLVSHFIDDLNTFAVQYNAFMAELFALNDTDEDNQLLAPHNEHVVLYYQNSRGASTDLTQRNNRLNALIDYMK